MTCSGHRRSSRGRLRAAVATTVLWLAGVLSASRNVGAVQALQARQLGSDITAGQAAAAGACSIPVFMNLRVMNDGSRIITQWESRYLLQVVLADIPRVCGCSLRLMDRQGEPGTTNSASAGSTQAIQMLDSLQAPALVVVMQGGATPEEADAIYHAQQLTRRKLVVVHLGDERLDVPHDFSWYPYVKAVFRNYHHHDLGALQRWMGYLLEDQPPEQRFNLTAAAETATGGRHAPQDEEDDKAVQPPVPDSGLQDKAVQLPVLDSGPDVHDDADMGQAAAAVDMGQKHDEGEADSGDEDATMTTAGGVMFGPQAAGGGSAGGAGRAGGEAVQAVRRRALAAEAATAGDAGAPDGSDMVHIQPAVDGRQHATVAAWRHSSRRWLRVGQGQGREQGQEEAASADVRSLAQVLGGAGPASSAAHPSVADPSNVFWMPLGYGEYWVTTPSLQTPLSQRPLLWAWAGSDRGKPERTEMLGVFSKPPLVTHGELHVIHLFRSVKMMAPAQYTALMYNAQVVPVPKGVHAEQYRLWEVLAAGAVPVAERRHAAAGLAHVALLGFQLLWVNEWEDAPALLMGVLGNTTQQAELEQWQAHNLGVYDRVMARVSQQVAQQTCSSLPDAR